MYRKSEVYRVETSGESTVSCDASVLLTTWSDIQPLNITNVVFLAGSQ